MVKIRLDTDKPGSGTIQEEQLSIGRIDSHALGILQPKLLSIVVDQHREVRLTVRSGPDLCQRIGRRLKK